MCLLCVLSRWSRRVLTMLPWLVIPFIIVWALSQLLPPGYRLEVTSPRLACLAVLLSSLGWYELIMPWLASWRARRSALLRERKLIEAREAAKWRKEATRRCRNCLTPYKVQSPGAGKFTCTYCGHVSKRPFLEVPSGTLSTGGSTPGKAHSGRRLINGEGMPYFRGSWQGNRRDFGLWSQETVRRGCTWFGDSANASDNFSSAYSFSGVFVFILRILSPLGRIWTKLRGTAQAGTDCNDEASQKKKDELANLHGSRAERARKKADEKRQVRLEKELLEEEERKQREEVARLVEERRRQREEKLRIEKESEREAAAEREREIRRVRECERRRKDKAKDKGEEPDKDKLSKQKSEDVVRNETTKDTDGINLSPARPSSKFSDFGKGARGSLGFMYDRGPKPRIATEKFSRLRSQRPNNTAKRGSISNLNIGVPSQGDGLSKNKTDSLLSNAKSTKLASYASPSGSSSSSSSCEVPASSGSAWTRAPWAAWRRLTEAQPEESAVAQTRLVTDNDQKVDVSQEGGLTFPSSHKGPTKPTLAPVGGSVIQPPIAPPSTHIDSLHQLFSSPSIFPPIDIQVDFHNQHEHNSLTDINASFLPEHTFFETPATCVAFQPSISFSQISQSSTASTPVPAQDSLPFSVHPASAGTESSFFQQMYVDTPQPVSLVEHLSAPNDSSTGLTCDPAILIPDSTLTDAMKGPKLNTVEIKEPFLHSQGNDSSEWDFPAVPMENGDKAGEDAQQNVWNALELHDMKVPDLSTWTSEDGNLGQEALQLPPLSTVQCLFDAETLVPEEVLFSPHKQESLKSDGDEISGVLQVSSRKSIWSDISPFSTAVHIWDDADSHQKIPPEFVDCITQEIMEDPVITADGHSYERAAIEKWLKFHDTSPKTGEVLPPPPGGTGVDKTLRPNHILRGQIIEYKEKIAKMSELRAVAWNIGNKASSDFLRTPETPSVLSF